MLSERIAPQPNAAPDCGTHDHQAPRLVNEPVSEADRRRPCLDDATVLAIVNRRDGAITANLQGPIVLNAASRTGIQLVLSDRSWSTRHELARMPGAAAAAAQSA